MNSHQHLLTPFLEKSPDQSKKLLQKKVETPINDSNNIDDKTTAAIKSMSFKPAPGNDYVLMVEEKVEEQREETASKQSDSLEIVIDTDRAQEYKREIKKNFPKQKPKTELDFLQEAKLELEKTILLLKSGIHKRKSPSYTVRLLMIATIITNIVLLVWKLKQEQNAHDAISQSSFTFNCNVNTTDGQNYSDGDTCMSRLIVRDYNDYGDSSTSSTPGICDPIPLWESDAGESCLDNQGTFSNVTDACLSLILDYCNVYAPTSKNSLLVTLSILGLIAPLTLFVLDIRNSYFVGCSSCLNLSTKNLNKVVAAAKKFHIPHAGLERGEGYDEVLEQFRQKLLIINTKIDNLTFIDRFRETLISLLPFMFKENNNDSREKFANIIMCYLGIDRDFSEGKLTARRAFASCGLFRHAEIRNQQEEKKLNPVFSFFERLKNEKWGKVIYNGNDKPRRIAYGRFINQEPAYDAKKVLGNILEFANIQPPSQTFKS